MFRFTLFDMELTCLTATMPEVYRFSFKSRQRDDKSQPLDVLLLRFDRNIIYVQCEVSSQSRSSLAKGFGWILSF